MADLFIKEDEIILKKTKEKAEHTDVVMAWVWGNGGGVSQKEEEILVRSLNGSSLPQQAI